MFRAFLRCEYSEENILFWLACEDLKKEHSPEVVEEKARVIYEDYVSILSPREVRINSLSKNTDKRTDVRCLHVITLKCLVLKKTGFSLIKDTFQKFFFTFC